MTTEFRAAERSHKSILAAAEKKVLLWLAHRMPDWVNSDHLTVLGFLSLLAVGLSTVFGLQVFVIVGGVTRVIPLTGVTLPFISYGGASIVANFVLLALLLLVSDRSRRPVP